MIPERHPISYFYAAIQNEEYRTEKHNFIVEESIVSEERKKTLQSKIKPLQIKLEQLLEELNKDYQKQDNIFYEKIKEDYLNWKNTHN